MTWRSWLLAGAFTCASMASAQRVVYDSRLLAPQPRVASSEQVRIRSLAEDALRRGVWATRAPVERCDAADFQIHGVARGAFTARGAQQTAYLYTLCYFRPGSSQGLVILQGTQVVAHYAFTGLAHTMYALRDMNQNGFSELAFEGGFSGQGYTDGYLEIAELRPQRRYLARFTYEQGPQAYKDNCGTLEPTLRWTSEVIRVTPGPTPRFTAQTIQGECNNERVATSAGPLRPITVKSSPTGWIAVPIR